MGVSDSSHTSLLFILAEPDSPLPYPWRTRLVRIRTNLPTVLGAPSSSRPRKSVEIRGLADRRRPDAFGHAECNDVPAALARFSIQGRGDVGNGSMSDELAEKARDGDDSVDPTRQDFVGRNEADDESSDHAERSERSDAQPGEAASPQAQPARVRVRAGRG